jgi:predicted phosphoribosyltransferase
VIEKLHDRYVAGQLLAEKLLDFAKCPESAVLGLPRRGARPCLALPRLAAKPFPVEAPLSLLRYTPLLG